MTENGIDQRLLDEKLAELETARRWSPRVVAKLEAAIHGADDDALFRVNPIAFAAEHGIDESEAIDLFLHAAKGGLAEIEWHMICPTCGHLVHNLSELTGVHSHLDCEFCGLQTRIALDDYIHVSFTVAPAIRRLAYHDPDALPIEEFYLGYHFAKGVRYAGDHGIREVGPLLTALLADVPPGGSARLDKLLGPGRLEFKDIRNRAYATFLLTEGGPPPAAPPAVELRDGAFRIDGREPAPTTVEQPVGAFHIHMAGEMPSGQVVVDYRNATDARSPLWVMFFPADFQPSLVKFDSFLSGKRLITCQTFRELFRFETGPASEGIDVKEITFLFSDLKGSTALYERIGDLKAYHLVRQHFDALRRAIAGNSGAVVKTIGDAVMASFATPQHAVAAAVEMLRAIDAFNATIADAIELKIGIHCGASIVVTLNDRLDYFGQTVNIAARVQGLAGAGEICLSAEAAAHPGVAEALAGHRVAPERASVKGVSDALDVARVRREAPPA